MLSQIFALKKQILMRTSLEGEGFEPSKAMPSDLQSDPFGHLGIPPLPYILITIHNKVFKFDIFTRRSSKKFLHSTRLLNFFED
jgi:hypothetical protein